MIAEATLADIRARLPIHAVVSRVVRLRRSGASWRGACPFHAASATSQAFAVDPARNNFHCFVCGAHGDVFAFVMRSEGCDFPQAAARCAAEAGVPLDIAPGERRVDLPPPPPAPPPRDRAADRARARAWWDAARPIRPGSAQALYLAGRGLWPLPEAAHQVLRAWESDHPDTGRAVHEVMLARVDDADGAFTAVHRTYLAARPDGSVGKLPNVDAKRGFGPWPAGSAIRLMQPGTRLGVAEGIETALAAAVLFGLPVWATISAGGMERFVTPEGVRDLLILADRDKPLAVPPRPEGTGIHVARVLQARAGEAGLAAAIRVPLEPAGDYADVLLERLGRAA